MNDEFYNKCLDWKLDPVLWIREVIGVEPTEQQIAILNAIALPGAKIAVKSGTGTGKTSLSAWVITWFLVFHTDCKSLCTSPSSSQLFDNLWAECAKWIDVMPPIFKDQYKWMSDTIKINGSENRFAIARTARPEKPEALQGAHADNMLYIIDEASGVAQKVFEVAEGGLSTPDTRVLLMSNPTRADGYFYDCFNKNRKFWQCFTLNGEESPRVSREYIENSKAKYGEDSDFYRIRIKGEFPLASDDTLIRLCDIEAAIDRDIADNSTEKIAGLDIARYGKDACAIVIRHGNVIHHIDMWRNKDTMETCGKVKQMYLEKMFTKINVDVIGMGSGVADRLIEMGIPTCPINVAECSAMSEKFVRLRDELWWKARELFNNKLSRIEPKTNYKDDLIGELSCIKYRLTSDGKIKIETKDEMKKRGLESPNIADALCLSLAEGTVVSNSWGNGGGNIESKPNPDGWSAWVN